jgi:glycosyltransferase involved in cell wall biosynthesis
MILSICIPTYNRSNYLKVCLQNLLPQCVEYKNLIEIIVIDNNSSDQTHEVVNKFILEYSFLKYYRNPINLGYTGNQIKCYTLPEGYYTAFLSDDDVYLDTLLGKLLPILILRKYSFIALNYYSFTKNFKLIYKTDFAPDHNVEFKRPYDILNYPSVGHWSGFIINTDLAKRTLKNVIKLKSVQEFEKNRGIIGEVIHRSLANSLDPSLFFGPRLLAVNVPEFVDYDVFNHLYIDDYKFYLQLYNENYISTTDLEYRKNLIFSKLKKSILTQSFKYSNNELFKIQSNFDTLFKSDKLYTNKIKPYFKLVRFYPIKIAMKISYHLYKKFKI